MLESGSDFDITVVLGFDFGLKRIGVAVGQSLSQDAKPLTILLANKGEPQWLEVAKLIDEWCPNILVVGKPVNMDGTEQPITKAAVAFAEKLKQKFNLSVEMIDERLTTVEARQQIHDARWNKQRATEKVDAYAAKIMVDDYLRR